MKPNPLLSLPLVAVAAAAILVKPLSAQTSSCSLQAEVVVYAKEGFRGERIPLSTGDRFENLYRLSFPSGYHSNNRISSIEINGPVEVVLFEQRNFRGESIVLHHTIYDLDEIRMEHFGDWDNAVSSILVRPCPCRNHSEPAHDDSGNHDSPFVFSGHKHHSPFDRNDHRSLANDNRITKQYLDPRLVGIVQRAYQSTLRRAPDPGGLANYVRVLERRGWNESQLRRELRRSPEYRNVVVPRLVKVAYKDVLGRDPDPAGFRFYSSRMISHGWTEGRVRDALRKSPEYQARKRTLAGEKPRHQDWG